MEGWLISLSAAIGIVVGGFVWGKLWRARNRRRRRQAYIEAVRPIGDRLDPYQVLQLNEGADSEVFIDLTEIEGDDRPLARHERSERRLRQQ